MNTLAILVLIIGLLIFIAPIAISWWLYKFLARKFPTKFYKYLSFIPTFIVIYFAWTAFFPTESFYKNDFKKITQMEFPPGGTLLYKSATFPDQFGDYTSIFLIEVSQQDYQLIFSQVQRNGFKEISVDDMHSEETNRALGKTKHKVNKQFQLIDDETKDFYIAFFSDNKTILLRRASW